MTTKQGVEEMQIIVIAGCGICLGVMFLGRVIGGCRNDIVDNIDGS
jgi:hypothetical protein